MRQPWLLTLIALWLAGALACQAQQSGGWQIHGLNSQSSFEPGAGTNYFYHGGVASNDTTVVTFDKASDDIASDTLVAEGDVTILDHGHIWRGTNFIYNLKTGDVLAGCFKTEAGPYFIFGQSMGGVSNKFQTGTNAIISSDDTTKPVFTMHARTITIAPGDYIEARQATLYMGRVPIGYFPHYRRSLKKHPNNFEFAPGYRSLFGPYLYSAYNWYGTGLLDGTIHLDERVTRGVAGGPDLVMHLGNFGEASFRYYYADDRDPQADGISAPHLSDSRQRGQFYYDVYSSNTFNAKVVANYQSDPLVIRDFFLREYNENVEPASFAEATKMSPNWVLDGTFQPRLVNFFETVERMPDVKLTGLRQELGNTPFFYESETSAAYLERAFSETNVPVPFTNYAPLPSGFGQTETVGTMGGYRNYSAARADTFHQISLPENYFGWLNVTPHVSGRGTYYSDVDGPQIHTNEQGRGVFNTGLDVSFKASQVFKDFDSDFFDAHELRHIIQPEFDYGYTPYTSTHTPLFDYQLPSLRLLPIDFPDYNSIDSIPRENVVRLMLRNKLQTKRRDGIEDLVNWAIYTDWNLTRYSNNVSTSNTFSDFYSDLDFRPRSWITFNSSTRYDIADARWREAIERVFFQPSTDLSLGLGYYYLMNNDPEFQTYPGQSQPGHNLIDFSVYYKINENWAFHIDERFEAQDGVMQEQLYSLYRDLRSWTAALTCRLYQGIGQPSDFAIGVTFSLKAMPRYKLNSDDNRPSQLIDSVSAPTLFNTY